MPYFGLLGIDLSMALFDRFCGRRARLAGWMDGVMACVMGVQKHKGSQRYLLTSLST